MCPSLLHLDFIITGISGFVQTNPRPGWQGLPKRPAADEERGRTPDLVSDESAPNRSARTSCFYLHLGVTFFFFFFFYHKDQIKESGC
ncbi:hypothetical protein POPTR_009G048602v4 [Populus trichocarpa]|uniref:Uncharacterized protein n=1 Tax=Populus trichocarpa TaxID=3694 RepID=A0ACC0SGH8_POPTR|nr:hypothetical protein POPTR_009G048602v4 [Populus trichocarpa]